MERVFTRPDNFSISILLQIYRVCALQLNKMEKSSSTIYKSVGFYILKYKIGMGAFSQVYLAYDIRNLKKVAVKIMNSESIARNVELRKGVASEIRALDLLKGSPNVITLLDSFRTKRNHYFVYQLREDGTLDQLIQEKKFLSESEAVEYFKQIVNGYKALYGNNIVHRDLKPQNILLRKNKVEIADFGFCQILDTKEEKMEAMVGTLRYQAPELIRGDSYSSKCDIYSLGVLLYKMLFGQVPFLHRCQIQTLMEMQTQQLIFPDTVEVSEKIKNIIKKMLAQDQDDRLTWPQLFDFFLPKDRKTPLSGCFQTITNLSLSPKKNSSQATETTVQDDRTKVQLFSIDKAIKMHEQILNIAEILSSASIRFSASDYNKIVKVCAHRIHRQMQSLIREIGDSDQYGEIMKILRENMGMLENLSSAQFKDREKLQFQIQSPSEISLKPVLNKFIKQVLHKTHTPVDDMMLAAALVDIEKKRYILSGKIYSDLSQTQLRRRLLTFS